MKKNDLLLVKPSTGKWIFSTNRDESGWVPQTFILILNEVQSEKKLGKITSAQKTTHCPFQKVTLSEYTRNFRDGELGRMALKSDIFH